MRRYLPLLLLPLTACTLSSDPAADSVGKAEKAAHSGEHGETEGGRMLLPPDPKAPTLTFTAPANDVVFEPKQAKVEAGVVNVRFQTDGAHNWTLAGPQLLVWGEPAGVAVDVTHAVELPAGSYGFYCSVPGHDTAGMKGTLTVT